MPTPYKSPIFNIASAARDKALRENPNDQLSALYDALEVVSVAKDAEIAVLVSALKTARIHLRTLRGDVPNDKFADRVDVAVFAEIDKALSIVEPKNNTIYEG